MPTFGFMRYLRISSASEVSNHFGFALAFGLDFHSKGCEEWALPHPASAPRSHKYSKYTYFVDCFWINRLNRMIHHDKPLVHPTLICTIDCCDYCDYSDRHILRCYFNLASDPTACIAASPSSSQSFCGKC